LTSTASLALFPRAEDVTKCEVGSHDRLQQILATQCITWPFRAAGVGANADAAATTAAAMVERVNVMMVVMN